MVGKGEEAGERRGGRGKMRCQAEEIKGEKRRGSELQKTMGITDLESQDKMRKVSQR
jgi:hypothetical protein